MAFWQWSKTAATNANSDPSINWAEGMPPAQVNDDGRAMMARIAENRDDTNGLLLTTGTSTAYAVTTNQGLPATPNDGQLLAVSFHVQNGATPTLAADGGTAFPIQVAAGFAVAAASFDANTPLPLRFRAASSAWVMFQSGIAAQANGVSAGVVTNAGLANMAAWTLKGNNTGSSAAPGDFTIDSLTLKSPPASGDEVPIWDVAGGAMKKATLFTAPTVQRFTSGSALTYTPSAGMVRIKVRMAGGGAGGGAQTTNAGSNGGNSSFGGWGANGGQGGQPVGGAGGVGGSGGATGTGTPVNRVSGCNGQGGAVNTATITGVIEPAGGQGGANSFGGAGGGGQSTTTGTVGAANTGAGGGGAGGGITLSSGAGGGAGEYVEFWMTAAQVGASQTYTVGTSGAGGTAGGVAGGAGAAGVIVVEEFYI